jgi:hypothetical protein
VFWATGIHPFNSPLPFAQNEKRNLKYFKTIQINIWKKKRNTSANSVYAARFTRPYLLAVPLRDIIQPANIAYTGTLDEIK